MTGKQFMHDLQQKLGKQAWIESFQYPSMGEDASSPMQIILSAFGFRQIQAGAYNTIQQSISDMLSGWPGTGRPPEVQWVRPNHFDQYDLPSVIEFDSLRFGLLEPDRQMFLLAVESDWPVFDGHFPGQPILSGVLQLHWIAQYSHYFLKHNPIPTEICQLKFRHVFVPPGWLLLELNPTSETEVRFKVLSNDTVHAQGRLRYAA